MDKGKQSEELIIANRELAFQNQEKEKQAAQLIYANNELVVQNEEKEKRAAELIIANKELLFQNEEKEKRAAELIIANRELLFQNTEKEKRAAELIIANKELVFQKDEKEKRAAELIIANKELLFQNEEKEKRAAELIIANNELVFQNEEKEKRAAELIICNNELVSQNEEKEKRAEELILADSELKKAEDKINKANRLYSFISQVNQAIVHINNEEALFSKSCSIALEFGKFKMAWIGLFDSAREKITLAEQSGMPAEDVALFTDLPHQINGPQDAVVRTGTYYICNDMEHDFKLENWKPFVIKHGIRSCMVLPIKKSGNIIGTFNLYARELNFFDKEEIKLLVEVSGDISFALGIFEKAKRHRETEEEIKISEERYHSLFDNMLEAFALCKMVYEDGKPIDFIYLDVNNAFEKLTGLKNVIGKKVTEVIAGVKEDSPELFETYGRVAATGKAERFEVYLKSIEMWLNISVYSNEKEYFIAVFDVITDRKTAEQQKEFDKNNLNALINNTTDLMWSVDRNFNLITSNLPFDEMCRVNFGNVIAKGGNVLSTSYSPEMLNHFKQLYERAFAGEAFTETEHFEFPAEMWSEISYYPIRKGNEVIGTACHSRDITERKRTEENLRQSESKLREAQAMAHMGNWQVGIKDGINTWSDEVYRIFGIEPGEVPPTSEAFLSFIHPDDHDYVKGQIQNSFATLNDSSFEFRFIRKNGAMRYGSTNAHFEFDKDKKPIRLYGVIKDITEQKKAEGVLQLAQFAIDNSGDAIFWMTPDARIVNINEAACQLLGYSRQELLELSIPKIDPNYDIKTWALHFEELRRKGSLFFETVQRAKDGRLIPVEVRANYIRAEDMELNCAFIREISQRKRTEQERERITTDLVHRNKDLEQFSYIVSHNLRAPVANIMGISDLLNDRSVTDVKERFKLKLDLASSVGKLDEIIIDLNTILQVRQRIDERKELIRFSDVVDDIKLVLSEMMKKEHVTIITDFSALNTINSLRSYVHSIFYNLIINSIKYRNPDVAPVIEIKTGKTARGASITFKDNGAGIDLKKHRSLLFGLYKRFNETREGKGMGLFMVKMQVETLGGTISVTSNVDEGTEFNIEFENENRK